MSNPSFLGAFPKFLSIVAASAVLGGATCSAALIYQEDFSGGTTGLNGTTTDVGSGTWVAGTGFKENGAYTGAPTSSPSQTAWLPYAFENGFIYEATLTVSLTPSSNTNWFALGFTNRTPLTTTLMNGTDGTGPGAMGWALLRQNGNWIAFSGPGTNPPDVGIGGSGTNTSPSPFGTSVSNATIRLVLNTTGPRYVLDLYINGVQLDLTGTGLSYTFPTAQQFTGVGIGSSANDIGTFEQFTFSTVAIPEPSSIALLALGGVVAVVGLRRMRRA